MRESAQTQDPSNGIVDLKRAHLQLNWSELKREMGKRLEGADKQFLDQEIVSGVGPWGTASEAA